jgi:hypothetical protein
MQQADRPFYISALGLITALCGYFSAFIILVSKSGTLLPTMILPFAPALLCAPLSLLKKPLRLPFFALMVLLTAAAAYFFNPVDSATGLRIIYILAACAVTLSALPSMYRSVLTWEISAALVSTLIGAVLSAIKDFAAIAPLLRIQGITFLCLLLLYTNLSQLSAQKRAQKTNSAKGAPITNILMTAIVAALAVLIASYKSLYELAVKGLEALGRLIKKLLDLFALKESTEGGAVEGESEMMSLGAGNAEPSQFLRILEKIGMVIAVLAAVVIAVWLLKKLWGVLRAALKNLSSAIKRYIQGISQQSEGYTDETEELGGDKEKTAAGRWKRKPKNAKWDLLNGKNKVRLIYRSVVKHGESEYTARETLSDCCKNDPDSALALADAYDAARYGDKEIDLDSAEKLKELINTNKKHRD